MFNKSTLQKLKSNYSQTQEVKVFSNKSLPNAFNTFWSNIEKNTYCKDDDKGETIIKSEQKNEEKNINNNDKINNSKSFVNLVNEKDVKDEEEPPFPQVSRVLYMVKRDKQIEDKVKEKQLFRLWSSSDRWGCPDCNTTGDKWYMLEHFCKNNNNDKKKN